MALIGGAADFGADRIVGKQTPLKELLPKLERPMLFVSFIWILVIVADLVGGTSSWLLKFETFLQALPWVSALTATYGLQVIWIFASADQGVRSMSRLMGRRGLSAGDPRRGGLVSGNLDLCGRDVRVSDGRLSRRVHRTRREKS